MKKRPAFLIISIFTVIILFSTAAICNFCGVPLELKYEGTTSETEEENGGDGSGSTDEDEAGSSEDDSQGQQDSAAEEQQTGEQVQQDNGQNENNSPVIDKLEIAGMDVETAVAGGYFDELPAAEAEGAFITIVVTATDEDNDELEYKAYDSNGEDFDTDKNDNNHAEVFWSPPTEAGEYRLTIEVSDGKGGTDVYSIDMNFVERELPVAEFIVQDENLHPVGPETGMISLDRSYCTSGNVYAGDGESNQYFNGYISFDISDLGDVEVISAALIMNNEGAWRGEPFLGSLRLGVLDYGTGALSSSDGNIGAEMLVQFPNTVTTIDYHESNLLNKLQDKIDAENPRFQIKVYWSNPHSDDDSDPDGLMYTPSGISLRIRYE